MKIKNVNLEYWVFYLDFNENVPKRVNILKGLEEDIAKHIRSSENSYKHISNRDTLKEFLKTEFMYHYWCKSEYEYGLCSQWEKNIENVEKHDVWFQIEKNLDMITDYVIYKMDLKF